MIRARRPGGQVRHGRARRKVAGAGADQRVQGVAGHLGARPQAPGRLGAVARSSRRRPCRIAGSRRLAGAHHAGALRTAPACSARRRRQAPLPRRPVAPGARNLASPPAAAFRGSALAVHPRGVDTACSACRSPCSPAASVVQRRHRVPVPTPAAGARGLQCIHAALIPPFAVRFSVGVGGQRTAAADEAKYKHPERAGRKLVRQGPVSDAIDELGTSALDVDKPGHPVPADALAAERQR